MLKAPRLRVNTLPRWKETLRTSIVLLCEDTAKLLNNGWFSKALGLKRLCRTAQRGVCANVVVLRHSGSFILRRLHERYWSLRSAVQKESRLLQTHHILLGACLISFAQDKITDEEMLSAIKGFAVNRDLESVSDLSSGSVVSAFVHEAAKYRDEEPHMEQACSEQQGDRFPEPPLTVFIREYRYRLRELSHHFFHPTLESVNMSPIAGSGESDMNTSSGEDSVYRSTEFALTASRLNIQSDGTGFVDTNWQLLVDRSDLRVWRRTLQTTHLNTVTAQSKPTDANELSLDSKARYEYKLCGQFDDISALSFLEVQLNLAYRRHWDDRVLALDYLDLPHSSDSRNTQSTQPLNQSATVRWVVKFPFPMASREYVYVRRWWLANSYSTTCDTQPFALVVSRGCPELTQSRSLPTEGSVSLWSNPLRQAPVQVTDYKSELLIRAHNGFDEPGMTYFLTYYDDPRLSISDSTMNLFSSSALCRFVMQLHTAALQLERHGLPAGIHPIVFHPDHADPNVNGVSLSTSTKSSDRSPPVSVPVKGQSQSTRHHNHHPQHHQDICSSATAAALS